MTRTEELLFQILRSSLGTERLASPITLGEKEWYRLYRLALSQMVGALVYDELEEVENNMPGKLSSRWKSYREFSIKRFDAQLLSLNHLAAVLATENIKLMVLKGLGIALAYPKPVLRECGDIDIYCFEDYGRVNDIALKYGLSDSISREVMHSSLVVDGIHVENHHNLTNRSNKAEEFNDKLLLKFCDEQALTDESMPDVLFPSAFAGAFHLMTHTLSHLAVTGITVRHLCDIAMYFRKFADSMDLQRLFSTLEQTHLDKSAMLLLDICKDCLGVSFSIKSRNGSVQKEKEHIIYSIFNPFKLSSEVKDPVRKFYRKVKMFSYRRKMHSLIFGEPYPDSFLESFVFLHPREKLE